MLFRAIASWGRLVGRRHDPKLAEEERRVWVRYSCGVETTCRPADGPEPERLVARVQDVSRGGINLFVGRPFAAGEMLSVELPGADGACPSTVLACVVWVEARPEGEWSLGCTFAAELGDDDLHWFGAKRVKPPAPDLRSWERFPCTAQASFQLVREPADRSYSAQVVNISPCGVGLLTDAPVRAGELLSVALSDGNGKVVLTTLASVARVTARGDSETLLGCNFIAELGDKEMNAFL
jgi:hypothetical protein